MSDQNIENMLSQLIRMVGTMQADLQEMKRDQQEMKLDQQEMNTRLDKIEVKQEEQHKEILERFERLERDQDFIWEKTVKNERDLGNMKRQLNS
jgi:regulator of replication initiation timing